MTRLKLTIRAPATPEARQVLAEHFPFRVGRALFNDLPLPFTSISSRHLILRCSGGQLTVTDLDSTNGTRIAGQRLPPHQSRAIELPTELRLGEVRLAIESADDEDGFTMAQSSTQLRQMLDDAARRNTGDDTRPFFEVLSGPGTGRRYHLQPDGPDVVIGTDPSADIPLAISDLPSRLATVVWDEAQSWLVAEANVITCDQTPVTGRQLLRSGDKFVVGVAELLYFDPLEEALTSMDPARATRPAYDADQVDYGDDEDDVSADPSASSPDDSDPKSIGPGDKSTRSSTMGITEITLLGVSVFFLVATLALLVVFFVS